MTSVAFLDTVAGLASSPNLSRDYFSVFRCLSFALMGRAVAWWLKHYATNRQVAGSIPDGVIGSFH
jgi:hypothetical protein